MSVPHANETITFAAAKLGPGSTYIKELYLAWSYHPQITSALFSLLQCSFVTHDRKYKILQDVIHLTIRALQKIVHNYQTGDDYYKKLNNIMFHSAILVIIMSWTSATADNIISCDSPLA